MSTMKKLHTRIKQIRKAHPNMTFRTAQKQAGREMRGKKVSGVKKRRVTGIKKNADRKDNKRVNITVGAVGTVSGHMGAAKKMLAEQIGWAEACKFQAKTKTDKKKIGKKIAELKAKYRKLS